MEKPELNENLSQIALKGSFYTLFSLFVLKFGGLFFTIILARMLVPESFGIYALTLSIINIAMVFTNLGTDEALLRYLSLSIARKKENSSKKYFKYLLKIKILLILTTTTLILIFARSISYEFYKFPLLYYPLMFSCLFLISESFRTFFSQIFPAKKDVKTPLFFDISFQILKIVLSIFALLILTDKLKISGIFIAFFITSFITLILSLVVILRRNKDIFQENNKKIDKKEVNSYLKYMGLASLSLAFFGSIDSLMLGKAVSADYLGYYRIALSLILSVSALFPLSSIFVPLFTQIKKDRFQRGFKKTTRYMLMFTIPASVGIFFIGKHLIRILYGQEYILGASPLYFLCPLIIVYPLISIYSTILQSKGKSKIIGKSVFFVLIPHIILNLATIIIFAGNPIYILGGVAISTTLSKTFLLFLLFINSKKELNLEIKRVGLKAILIGTFGMSLFLFLFNKFIQVNIFLGILQIIIAVFIYFSILILFKELNKKDIKLLKNSFRKNK